MLERYLRLTCHYYLVTDASANCHPCCAMLLSNAHLVLHNQTLFVSTAVIDIVTFKHDKVMMTLDDNASFTQATHAVAHALHLKIFFYILSYTGHAYYAVGECDPVSKSATCVFVDTFNLSLRKNDIKKNTTQPSPTSNHYRLTIDWSGPRGGAGDDMKNKAKMKDITARKAILKPYTRIFAKAPKDAFHS